jgi:hypothetical protein
MSYDPGWWKAAFQVAAIVLSILIGICTLGSWYFGRREAAATADAREKQRPEDRDRLKRMEAALND